MPHMFQGHPWNSPQLQAVAQGWTLAMWFWRWSAPYPQISQKGCKDP